jgi:hypothetical protein
MFLIDVPTTLQDDGWGDFDVGADAQAAPVDSEALTKAKLELEQKFQASEARIAELESQLAAKADTTPAARAAVQDDQAPLAVHEYVDHCEPLDTKFCQTSSCLAAPSF